MQYITIRLQQLVAEVPRRLAAFSTDEMTLRPAPGKWSKREIMGHLCDSALHNWQRFLAAQHQPGVLEIKPYPQNELVRLNQYQDLPTGQIVALWASLNTQVLAVLKSLPAERLQHPVQLPDGTRVDLGFWADDYLSHLEHHLSQVFGEKTAAPALPSNWHIPLQTAVEALSQHPLGKPFVTLLEQGRMYVELYQPQGVDLQKPHDQDEIYVVASGSGWFSNNGERRRFGPGDLIFVPAGVEHRFEAFTSDFRTWVIFY